MEEEIKSRLKKLPKEIDEVLNSLSIEDYVRLGSAIGVLLNLRNRDGKLYSKLIRLLAKLGNVRTV